MLDETKMKKEQSADLALLSGSDPPPAQGAGGKGKTPAQKTAEAVIMVLPLLCGGIALLEYLLVPNNSRKPEPVELCLGAPARRWWCISSACSQR